MKKIITSIIAAVMAVFITGCDKNLTPERMTTISTVIGRTAGYACELSKTKTEVKETIMKVLDIASIVVPTNGQTYAEAWSPVIDKELAKLVEAGKIDAAGPDTRGQTQCNGDESRRAPALGVLLLPQPQWAGRCSPNRE